MEQKGEDEEEGEWSHKERWGNKIEGKLELNGALVTWSNTLALAWIPGKLWWCHFEQRGVYTGNSLRQKSYAHIHFACSTSSVGCVGSFIPNYLQSSLWIFLQWLAPNLSFGLFWVVPFNVTCSFWKTSLPFHSGSGYNSTCVPVFYSFNIESLSSGRLPLLRLLQGSVCAFCTFIPLSLK